MIIEIWEVKLITHLHSETEIQSQKKSVKSVKSHSQVQFVHIFLSHSSINFLKMLRKATHYRYLTRMNDAVSFLIAAAYKNKKCKEVQSIPPAMTVELRVHLSPKRVVDRRQKQMEKIKQ